eukprot:TRINITY_DN54244_c0_g1_i6.p1 TRINITY_DN54244_c0_g1~~TRINITY_DN54244_c0_g1_i6.p1  ORF type:complete len:1916 (+),score=373.28 TRINITY_DN54244_c0_g1_i6:573-5750(+)
MAMGDTAILSLGDGLAASTFYAFELAVRLVRVDSTTASSKHFKITTATASTELDAALEATWSSAVSSSSGLLVYPESFDCYDAKPSLFDVIVTDMTAFRAGFQTATATLLFSWDKQESIPSPPLSVRLYAPSGYKWEIQANGDGLDQSPSQIGEVTTPLVLYPGFDPSVEREDMNSLHLQLAQQMQPDLLYGLAGLIAVPPATPGSAENPGSGGSWFLLFGEGSLGEQRQAAGVSAGSDLQVRSIIDSTVQLNAVSDTLLQLSATFASVTALPRNGLVRLVLPRSYTFAARFGKACSMGQPLITGNSMPVDAEMSCTALSEGRSALQWTIGARGLAPGSYVIGGVVRETGTDDEEEPRNDDFGEVEPEYFVFQGFLDSGATQVADVEQRLEAHVPSDRLARAEVPMGLWTIDVQPGPVDLFDLKPGQATWVIIAFEVFEAQPFDVAIDVEAPLGYHFNMTCGIHTGSGTGYLSVFGDDAAGLPPQVRQYRALPEGLSATCEGSENRARIVVRSESAAVLPRSLGQLYALRVHTKNPQKTPDNNVWQLTVGSQKFAPIAGYELWELRSETSVMPVSTAAGDEHLVTVRFRNGHPILGLRKASDHGVLIVRMPKGFEVVPEGQWKNGTGASNCRGFTGLLNTTLVGVSKIEAAGMVCDVYSSMKGTVFLRNRMDAPLYPSQYEFSFMMRNPAKPVEAMQWKLVSYDLRLVDWALRATLQRLRDEDQLEILTIDGFAVNPVLQPFTVAPFPLGLQKSGEVVTVKVGFLLAQEVAIGDKLVVTGPSEYSFEDADSPGECFGFRSGLLPPPRCARNRIEFDWSRLAASSSLMPAIQPAGAARQTALTFEVKAVNPPTKPLMNLIEVVHCRSAAGATSSMAYKAESARCGAGATVLASVRRELWPIIPRLENVSVQLLAPREFAAQGRRSPFVISFLPTSPRAATRLRVQCAGMDFSMCSAAPLSCEGQMGMATISLLPGQTIDPGNGLFSVTMIDVVNPDATGLTSWSLSTYELAADGSEVMVDEAVNENGYPVRSFLPMLPSVDCDVEALLDPTLSATEKAKCTTTSPWFEQRDCPVALKFPGLGKYGSLTGHRMLIQPPVGFSFTVDDSSFVYSNGSTPFVVPLEGFPTSTEVLQHRVARVQDLHELGLSSDFAVTQQAHLSKQVLLVDVDLGEATTLDDAFALKVRVNNPSTMPATNLWRVITVDAFGDAIFVNDDAWQGFIQRGTFLEPPSGIEWLVSDFPSESNIVRLTAALASPLTGTSLELRVAAPKGFEFESNCLPQEPDIVPRPGLSVEIGQTSSAWVRRCLSETSARHIAKLSVAALDGQTTYAVNLLVKNPSAVEADAAWQFYTFANMQFTFVHYTRVPSFRLRLMEAKVLPEVARFETASKLHVVLTPERVLGPHGEVVVTAPKGFALFCGLDPFFDEGNLPPGVECGGANEVALVRLSGRVSLDVGKTYRFTVRVQNPSLEAYTQEASLLSDPALPPAWSVRLQTKDKELVHEAPQVAGYRPTQRSIERFVVTTASQKAGDVSTVTFQFKLETELVRLRSNRIELIAPHGYRFQCAETLRRESFVVPQDAILRGEVERYKDLLEILERPPTQGTEAFQNEGTTATGRSIVDCSYNGRLLFAIDFTDEAYSGKIAFKTLVQNALVDSSINMWRIRSFADGQLLEEGAAGGYMLRNMTDPEGSEDDAGAVNGAKACRAWHSVLLSMAALAVPMRMQTRP